jgi:hypothetical protein
MRLADVVQCPAHLWEQAPGRRLSQKHIDFVLYDSSTTRIVVAIELDDSSHQEPRRRARDRFVDATMKAANTPLIRVRAAHSYDVRALREVLLSAASRSGKDNRSQASGAVSPSTARPVAVSKR